ncbi:MAG: tRNA epoxyqueuosine(34) reductase QueG [Gemmatimonadaceae bacterium]
MMASGASSGDARSAGPLPDVSGFERAASLEARLEAQAYALGFDLVGFVRLGPADTAVEYDAWIARGYAGDMHYLESGAAKRADSRLPFEGAVSGIVVAMNYGGTEPSGPVARYARGDDYHEVMTGKLRQLHAWLRTQLPAEVPGKAYVDTGPILERDLARRAGLGWFGKNTNLIHPTLGSYFFLGALFVGIELAPSDPFDADRCGTCRRCLDACPTDAFVGARELDATRCISYLTIEHRGSIPEALRPLMGELVYGCDICQEVCPWNVKFATELREPAFAPREGLDSTDSRAMARALLAMSVTEFQQRFRGSPMKRAKRRGLARNAAVVLGNAANAVDVPALSAALSDEEPLVRGHAAWALGRIASASAMDALSARQELESDPSVLVELRSALGASR